jgi:hypothetical protein
MTNVEYIRIVRAHLGEREILEQIAEEASELAQAALKCIRAMESSKNPTTLSLTAASADLVEEYGDLGVAWDAFVLPGFEKTYPDEDLTLTPWQEMKLKRWVERLTGEKV